jgi:drug/metabolite transporter (DMT)-like permease
MAFLMPAFGMLWGAVFLGEPITLPMIAGLRALSSVAPPSCCDRPRVPTTL